METASSRTTRVINVKKIHPNIKVGAKIKGELTRDISMCPAIILAASRTERVKGRINLLTISIITINGIRAYGVPLGTKWERKKFVPFAR